MYFKYKGYKITLFGMLKESITRKLIQLFSLISVDHVMLSSFDMLGLEVMLLAPLRRGVLGVGHGHYLF